MSIFGDTWRAIRRKPARWFIGAAQAVAEFLKSGRKPKGDSKRG